MSKPKEPDISNMTIIPMTPKMFREHFDDLILSAMRDGIPPEFLVMCLSMKEHELANYQIAIVRQAQEKQAEEKAKANESPIVNMDGKPLQSN